MTDASTVYCAWCEAVLNEVPAVEYGVTAWYGLCASCAGGPAQGLFPTSNLAQLSEAEYDALPFGLLEVDRLGRIATYNAGEEQLSGLKRQDIIGKQFFVDVAPCTRVQEFEGVFYELFAREGSARSDFDFVFRFAGGDRFVHIAMCREPGAHTAFILVQVAAEQMTAQD